MEYATALDDLAGDASGSWHALAWLVEEAAYGEGGDGEDARDQALQMARHATDQPTSGARSQAAEPGVVEARPSFEQGPVGHQAGAVG